MKAFIGIDIGTTHTKAIALDESGQLLASEKIGYPLYHPDTGYSEQNPDEILEAVISVLALVNKKIKRYSVSFVSFSSAMHSLMAVDKLNKPLTNLITWADNRSGKIAKELLVTDNGKLLWQQTGVPVHAMSPLCKLLWLKENKPAVFNAAYKFIGIKEYIFYKFFGKFIIDTSIASATGFLNIKTLQWNQLSLQTAGVDENCFSLLVSPGHTESNLNQLIQEKTGLQTGIPFIIGASDGALANIGCGAIENKEAALTIGTSGALRRFIDQPVADRNCKLFTYHAYDNFYINGGAVNNGGIAVKYWVEEKMKQPDKFDKIIMDACSVAAGSDGLVCLPYFFGERAPVWDAEAQPVFYGNNAAHTDFHFVRSIMEGICFNFKTILSSVEDTGDYIETIYASGGFTESAGWLQMMADILQKKILVVNDADASATGAIFLGMKAMKIINNLSDCKTFLKTEEEYTPGQQYAAVYTKNYNIFKTLYIKKE